MRIEIGPVTRLEGHLNVLTTVKDNTIVEAQCVGEMFRGFEMILRGRDPLDAQQITQRICGVCPYAHAIASSYAQEQAFGLRPPPNGRIMHNLIQGANHLYDYLFHFYQLAALDFVDITAVLKYSGKDASLVKVRDWVKAELNSGRKYPAAPFLPRLEGRYIEDVDANVSAIKHYLEAMEVQKVANQASAIFGGKFPHATAIFPGGCTQEARIDLIASYRSKIKQVRHFIHEKYLPDVMAVAATFPEYWDIGASQGGFLSYGMLPRTPAPDSDRLMAGGVLFNGQVTDVDFERITQDIGHSKYSSASGQSVRNSAISPDPHKEGAYSWIKAPRYHGDMVEVGPAARIMVDYHQGHNPQIRQLVDHFIGQAGIRPAQLNSVLGRHLCRVICSVVIADFLLEECERLDPAKPTMAELVIPKEAEGFGATEASRGGLLHYLRLEDHKIATYECVVPTTWNASPQDDRGRPGAMESALVGTKVADPQQQIEANRIIRSFDPCMACSVH